MNKIKSYEDMWKLICKAAEIARKRQNLLITKKITLGDGFILIIGTSSYNNIETYILTARVFNEFDREQDRAFNEYFSK